MHDRATLDAGVSDLIGRIYDCAILPSLWDETLDELRKLLGCANAILYVTDPRTNDMRLEKLAGVDPYWAGRLGRHETDLAELHAAVPDYRTRPLDRPFVCRRDAPADAWFANRYYREWAEPQGIVDAIDTILMRTDDRMASCALCRHERFGLIGDSEIELAGLVAPHLRRAITISDLIDMKALQAEALNTVLDGIAVGIVLVGKAGSIVHANRSAEWMFKRGGPICAVSGRLATTDTSVTARLRHVLANALETEAELGGEGIGMGLPIADGAPATAHILPLARGDLRTQLVPRAVAAVFVATAGVTVPDVFTGVADAFGLTPAETRVLSRLTHGASIDEAAGALGISRPTVKTHIKRILSKTGARRQADLVALVRSLTPPTGPPLGE